MSENEVEEKKTLEEQVICEEAIEETEEAQGGIGEPKVSFIKSLSAIIVDEVIIGIIAITLFYIFEASLRLGGYFIAQKISMIFILFLVVSILYNSIMETAKAGQTLGKKLLNL